ncbi:MAG: restriction endonuclease subunit S [Candidatus Moranbacteria bacterium]|nr:restriction endonuclease subunit S [Candidatus Moranbacteria bacterium]
MPKQKQKSPETFIVWSDEVVSRLDPFFYRPVFKKLIASINDTEHEAIPLGDIVEFSVAGDWGEDPNTFEPNPDYTLCNVLRNTNFDNKYNLNFDDVAQRYVRNDKVEKLALQKGEILIEKSGGSPVQPVGRVAFVEELPFENPVVFSNFLQKIKIADDGFLPEYVFTYLQAIYHLGYTEFLQNQTTGIKNLRLDDFFNIKIIKLPKTEQKKVAKFAFDMREKAKRLELQALETLDSVDDYVLGELGIATERERERVSDAAQIWQIWSDVIERRLDPMYFHPERMRAIESIKKSNLPISQLSEVVNFRREIVSEIPENLPYVGLENIISNSGEYVETGEKESVSSAFVFKKGDVLFPKLRPYLNKVFYADFDGVCSTEFHVLEAQKCSPFFLFSFLSRSVVVEQTSRLMTGNTLPRLQTDDVKELLVPIPKEEKQEKITSGVRSYYEKMRNLREEATSILSGAQAQVEQMILA